MSRGARVISWGIGGSVVDLGRASMARLGLPRGGAVDTVALRLANRLVGNAEQSAGLETSGGLVIEFSADTMVAVTGAVAEVRSDLSGPVGWGAATVLRAGSTLHVARLVSGARAYVSVRGGVSVYGDLLEVGDDPRTPAATVAAVPLPLAATARVWPGPRLDWFDADAWRVLCGSPFTVTATSRVGVRLAGSPLRRAVPTELPSEGMVEGAVQVPPSGDPIVMLADHPTTGGYPVIGVVDPADLHVLAQAAVGSSIRLVDARRRG